jgi:hypothetical protein
MKNSEKLRIAYLNEPLPRTLEPSEQSGTNTSPTRGTQKTSDFVMSSLRSSLNLDIPAAFTASEASGLL